jgi:hypothetical protein
MVRMPAPIAPLIGFALGVAFAWYAREELSRSPSSTGITFRSLAIVTLFATLVFAPVSAYFLAFESDWSYAYFIDTRRIPSAIQLALVVIDTVSAPLGFLVATPHAKSRKLGPLFTLALPLVALALAGVAATTSRLSVQGSYAQFQGDFGTRPVAGSSLGYALLWMDMVLALGALWTCRQLSALVLTKR